MSIFGTGTNDFASLTGIEEDYASFNDIEVNGNIYLKQPDEDTGFNSVLITNQENISGVNNENNIVNNLTGFNDNWMITLGTGQDTFEEILKINPQNGIYFDVGNNNYNLSWNELSYLNGASSNIQQQIDNLNPDLSSNQGYWGNFWNSNTLTNPTANAVNVVSFPSSDIDNYGFSISNNSRVVAGHAGIYMFIATIQINKSQGSTEEDVFFWIRKNGANVADSAFKDSIKSEPKLICANWQLKLQANEYVELAWSSPDIHVQLVAYGAGSTPTKPAIPSVIFTASQVSFLVNGGAGLLPLTYNTGLNQVTCDASFNVNGYITTNQHPRYTGSTPTISNSINDYVPRAYIDANYVNRSTQQTVGGLKTWTSSQNFNQNILVNQLANISRLMVTGDTSMNNVIVRGNIDISGNLTIDCGSVNWQGTRNYGYYNLVSYIQAENGVTRNVLDSVGSTANNALNTANQAISDANGAWNRAGDALSAANNAQNRADDAYDLAAAAQATGAAAAAVASGAAAASALNTTAIGVLQGQVTGLEATTSTLSSKTAYMKPVNIPATQSEFFNKIGIFQTEISPSAEIVLNPFGKSTFSQELETSQKLTANSIDLAAGQVQNLRGATVNIADANGATNIDCASVTIGNVASSSIQIGSSTSTINANSGIVNIGNINTSTIRLGSSSSTINANVASLNLGNEALSTITIGSNTSTLNANVSDCQIGNVAASNVRLGSSSSNITIGGLGASIYIGGFLYIPFNPANFVTALSQWAPATG